MFISMADFKNILTTITKIYYQYQNIKNMIGNTKALPKRKKKKKKGFKWRTFNY